MRPRPTDTAECDTAAATGAPVTAVAGEQRAYDLLQPLTVKPAPFSIGAPVELWGDPHVQQQMLEFHLDPDTDAASRKHVFIERSLAWLVEALQISDSTRVLDLGCGPGLYANPLADVASCVHGVDLNPVAVATARRRATRGTVSFEVGDYLRVPLPDHDVALLLYCDYCAMSPGARGHLLDRIRPRMSSGGRLLLDVHSEHRFAAREEGCTLEDHPTGGFWSSSPHVVLHQRFIYDRERVTLDRHVVVEPTRTRTIHNWLAHFTREELESELRAHGFVTARWFGDVAGEPIAATPSEYAVIAVPD